MSSSGAVYRGTHSIPHAQFPQHQQCGYLRLCVPFVEQGFTEVFGFSESLSLLFIWVLQRVLLSVYSRAPGKQRLLQVSLQGEGKITHDDVTGTSVGMEQHGQCCSRAAPACPSSVLVPAGSTWGGEQGAAPSPRA